MPRGFSIVLRKTMVHIWCKLPFVYWSVYDRKVKMETIAMNMRTQTMICIKLKLVPKRFTRMPQIQNSQVR